MNVKKRYRIIYLFVLIIVFNCSTIYAQEINEDIYADTYAQVITVQDNSIQRHDTETKDVELIGLKETVLSTTSNTNVVRTTTQTGQWIQASDGRWWYRHSDGSYTTNNWEYINGKWYYFDASGWMVTGWINLNGTWYYLNSNGAMVTNWQLINGKWYYFDASGRMATGWINLNEKWYYLDSSGAMVTGWHKIAYEGQYNNNPYWNYFDSNGAYVTDSDVKGCDHGINTYVDHKCMNSSYMNYIIATSKIPSNTINSAAARWNNKANCHASFTLNSSIINNHINVSSSTNLEANTLAITYFYYNGKSVTPMNSNWAGCSIVINENKTVSTATIAHEFGHTLGLSHRISKKSSIMCQQGQGRTATAPITDDVSVVNHLY